MLLGFVAAACGCYIPSPGETLLLGPHLLLELGRDEAFATLDQGVGPAGLAFMEGTRWKACGCAPLPQNFHPASAPLRFPALLPGSRARALAGNAPDFSWLPSVTGM